MLTKLAQKSRALLTTSKAGDLQLVVTLRHVQSAHSQEHFNYTREAKESVVYFPSMYGLSMD